MIQMLSTNLLHLAFVAIVTAVPCALAAQELSLHDAIQEAMNGPEAAAAAARTDEAKGQLKQAGLGLNPRLFLQSEDWRPWADNFDFGTQTENYAFLSQTFETDGKRSKRMALAKARLKQTQAEQEAARYAIAGRVAGAYWNAVVLGGIAALLTNDIQVVDGMVEYDRARVNEGVMRGVDLLRMKVERDRLLLAQQSAQREASQAKLELLKQIGRSPAQGVPKLTDSIEAQHPVPPAPVEQVLATRPDLQAAREMVQAAEADVALQKAISVPNVDLVGGYKRNNANNTGYSALQFDLPFRNRNQGEVERARAAVRYAQSSYSALELRVRAETVQSEEAYKTQQKIVNDVLPDMRGNARENLRLLTEAYRMGGVDLLRFLDAERTEFDVEVSALRAYADLQQSALRLQLSYGVQP